jgi:CheY-like chemotaxis protein
LSIAYRLVEGHGGTLTAERRDEGGAAFTIRLPPTWPSDPQQRSDTSTASAGERSPTATPPRRILVVDADTGVQRMIDAFFASEGHEVETAADAQHALSLLASTTYDLVIADARAAVSADESFVDAYVADHPNAKARTILLTADVRPETDAWLEALGVRFLHKPFTVRDLRTAARAILHGEAAGDPAKEDAP